MEKKFQSLFWGAGLFLATFLFDIHSFGHEFIWDDEFFIQNNRYLSSWEFLPKIFTSSITEGASGRPSNFFRPIQAFTHFIDVQLFGLNPWWHHVTNGFLHALSAALLFFLMRNLLGKNSSYSAPAAFGAVSLWIFHPLQSEVVGYLSGRGDILVCLFSAAAGLAWPRNRAMAAFFCGCAMFSKENGVLAPLLVFLCDFVERPRDYPLRRWLRYWPLVIPAILYGVIRSSLLSTASALNFYESSNVLTEHYSYRVFTYLSTIGKSMELLFWPHDLHHERSWSVFTGFDSPYVWIGTASILVLVALAAWAGKKRPLIVAGVAWFFLAGLPTSNLIALINALLYDHWFTVPALGFAFLAAAGIRWLLQRHSSYWAGGLWALAIIPLLLVTWKQHATWASATAQYEHILSYEPRSWKILNNLGMIYANQGDQARAAEMYERSLGVNETPEGRNNLGNLYLGQGKYFEAERELKRAMEIDPRLYQAPSNLGKLSLMKRDCAGAKKWFEAALAIYPDPAAQQGLAIAKSCGI